MRSALVSVVLVVTFSCGGAPIAPEPGDAGDDDGGVAAAPEDAGTFDEGNEDGDYDGGDELYDAGTDAPEEDAGLTDAGVAPPEVTSVTATYRVLQWNIAGGKENDCRADLIARAVKRFVVEQNIDFVSLNEVCPAQHEAIREALRAAWGLGPNATLAAYQGDGLARVVGDGIYSRFGLTGVTKVQLGTDQYGSRNLVCGRVSGEPHLRVCTTHLSVGDTTASHQMLAVLGHLEDWWTTHGDTVFLAGDLNLTANHAGLDPVYSSSVNTANNRDNTGRYHELDDDDAAHCLGYGERSTPGANGGPCGEGGKIDFIFVRQNRIVSGDYDADTLNIPDDCTGVCSDHRLVIGRVQVRVRRD